MCKWQFFFAVFLLFPARAEDILISGSNSPDQKYAVYAVDARTQGGVASLEVCEKSTKRVVFDLGGSGWVETAKGLALPGNTVVLWNANGTYFALKMREAKTSSTVTLYKVSNQEISRIPLPDFSTAIRKQIGFDFSGRFYFESPVKWENIEQLVLNIQGNTVDSIDPDGEYDFSYNLTFNIRSGKILHIEEIKKALSPPSRK